DVDETGSGEDPLHRDVAEAAHEAPQQSYLVVVPRCEVAVPSFRCPHEKTSVGAKDEGLAEPRAGRDEREVPASVGATLVENREPVPAQGGDRVSGRLEVVHEEGR